MKKKTMKLHEIDYANACVLFILKSESKRLKCKQDVQEVKAK